MISHRRTSGNVRTTIASIARRGFADTTLAHVADGAKLSRGIVNFYFRSKEELLVDRATLSKMWVLRRILNPMGTQDAMEFLLDKLKYSKTNQDFFDAMNT